MGEAHGATVFKCQRLAYVSVSEGMPLLAPVMQKLCVVSCLHDRRGRCDRCVAARRAWCELTARYEMYP